MRRLALLLPFVLLLAACGEKLAGPADCPTLCPAGRVVTVDTILTPVVGGDSSYAGFVDRGRTALLVSSGLQISEDRLLVTFAPRPDTVTTPGGPRPYVVDSAGIGLSLVGADTSARNVRLVFYRLPRTVDTTFAAVDALLTPANVIDSLPVPLDSLVLTAARPSRALLLTIRNAALTRIALTPADSGVLTIGVRVRADGPTGLRFAGVSTSTAVPPAFASFVRPANPADGTATTLLTVLPPRPTFVSRLNLPPTANALQVGDSPSARALIRFVLPSRLRDSAQVLRATLELVPTRPQWGLTNDPALLQVRAVQADFGAKSVLLQSQNFVGAALLTSGVSDTLRIEIGNVVNLWTGPAALPPALMLSLLPEAGSFTRAEFGSTRAGIAPRLRLTYQIPFPFARP